MISNRPAWAARQRDRLEDLYWLAESGEGATTAAARLGLNRKALEEWLRRHDQAMWRRLRDNEKCEWKAVPRGVLHGHERWAS